MRGSVVSEFCRQTGIPLRGGKVGDGWCPSGAVHGAAANLLPGDSPKFTDCRHAEIARHFLALSFPSLLRVPRKCLQAGPSVVPGKIHL